MSFQVYYRKWRPQTFGQLVGQEHASATLRQAVHRGRVGHSYLLCGPRGTGKTSSARVLAKAVNCLDSQEGDPCDQCGPCVAIKEGRFMDLIELDAASNRGIDEIRNIRDRVNLSPVEGGYKVYIIDEAHMLTEHASNAFLKTLEEPPPHAIFILCTTEPHKILPTIISRCQRFDFRRLSAEVIMGRLDRVCQEEGVSAEPEALKALAYSAGGSLRDAENLLEQLVVSYGEQVGAEHVRQLLGLGHGERALELTRYLLAGKTPGALGLINQSAWDGEDLRHLHRQTVDLLRGVLMIQCDAGDSLDMPRETVAELQEMAPRVPQARVMKSLRLLGEVNMRYDAASPLALELAVVEACMEGAAGSPVVQGGEAPPSPNIVPTPQPQQPPARQPSRGSAPARAPVPQRTRAVTDPGEVSHAQPEGAAAREADDIPSRPPPPAFQGEVQAPAAPTGSGEGQGAAPFQEKWGGLVRLLSRYKGRRFNIGALLRDCKSQYLEGETLVLTFGHRSHLERMQEEMDDPEGMRAVSQALARSLGASYQLRLVLSDDAPAPGGASPSSQSPLVRAALNMGGRIMEERDQQ